MYYLEAAWDVVSRGYEIHEVCEVVHYGDAFDKVRTASSDAYDYACDRLADMGSTNDYTQDTMIMAQLIKEYYVRGYVDQLGPMYHAACELVRELNEEPDVDPDEIFDASEALDYFHRDRWYAENAPEAFPLVSDDGSVVIVVEPCDDGWQVSEPTRA